MRSELAGFEIWAAVDLLDRECVQLRGGDPATARFRQRPEGAAERWLREGADGLHLIDLNAALGADASPNTEALERLLALCARHEKPAQIGGGLRSVEAVEGWLRRGAARAIVGTRAVREPGWLNALVERFPRRIVLAMDVRGGEVLVEGWRRGSGLAPARLLDALTEEIGAGVGRLAALLYTNVDREGTLQGLDPEPLSALCGRAPVPVLVAGGLRSIDDVLKAKALGARGVVLGTALYAGTLRLPELKEALTR